MNHPGLSAAEKELCVPANTASLSRNRHSARDPLQVPLGRAASAARGGGPPLVTSTTARIAPAIASVATTDEVTSAWRRVRSACRRATPVRWSAVRTSPVSYTHLRAHETRHDLV